MAGAYPIEIDSMVCAESGLIGLAADISADAPAVPGYRLTKTGSVAAGIAHCRSHARINTLIAPALYAGRNTHDHWM